MCPTQSFHDDDVHRGKTRGASSGASPVKVKNEESVVERSESKKQKLTSDAAGAAAGAEADLEYLIGTWGTKDKDKIPKKAASGAWNNPDTRVGIIKQKPIRNISDNFIVVVFDAPIDKDLPMRDGDKIKEFNMDKNDAKRMTVPGKFTDLSDMYGTVKAKQLKQYVLTAQA